MVEYVQDMLGLPIQTLAVLAAGYLSYRVAYTGKDATHKTIDVIFLVSVYAFIAQITFVLAWPLLAKFWDDQQRADFSSGLLCIVAALFAACFWGKWGEKWTSQFLKWSGISFADRHTTAWETVMLKAGVNGTVLVVRKKDGSEVMSEELSKFRDLPFGSCIFGRDGSVGLYVTHRRSRDADDWSEYDSSVHEDSGAPVTVIPSSEIAEIEFRAA